MEADPARRQALEWCTRRQLPGACPLTRAFPALVFVPLLVTRGFLSLVLGVSAFGQSTPPPDTPNPSLFQLQHTAWTEREGAPPTINDIAQAPDGSLWLGSGEGLYRFDGFTFERVRAIDGDSPAPTEVYTLLATANGDLWIGTSFNGAILLRNGVARRFPKFEGIPLNTTVWGFVEDSDGTIWAATALGLQRFDGSQWRSVGKAWGVPEMVESWLQIDSNGTLWAETSKRGLFRLQRGLRHFERLPDLPQENFSFNQSPSGEYWATARSGICPLTEVLNGTAGPHCAVHDNWSTSPFSSSPILNFDRRGNLWTRSVRGGGVGRLDAAAFRDAFRPGHPEPKVESFTKRDGLTSDLVESISRDRRDGSIWIGTDHGLDHFREPAFLPALPKPGIASFGIQAQKDGRVWIGSIEDGGLWIASPEGKTERIALHENNIQSLYETQRGTLWFATYSPLAIGSINDPPSDRTQEGKTTSLPLTPELQSQLAIQSIVEDRGGAVWASFITYGLAKWEGGHWSKNGGLKGLPEAWVAILSTDPDGRIWAGYLNGEVAVIDGTSVRRYTAKDGLNIGPVAAILSGRSDCWLAGVNGLVRFDGRHFYALSGANNRPFSGITGIAQAKNGDLWLNSWEGVRRVKAAELREAEKNPSYAVHSDLYDLTDGLPSVPQRIRPFPTAVSAPDGRIWFGFRAGVVSVDPEDPSLRSPIPPVSIMRAIADGKTLDAVTNAKLAARTKNLEIDYSAVSLNRASRVRFRYKLEGMDSGWQNAGSRRQAFYNNLPPGQYQFVVSASNGDNLWNEAGDTLRFNIPPAFYQTYWFRSLSVILFLAGLFGIYQLRMRQLAHQYTLRLEERVSERTRIARELHDTLLQNFNGLLLRFQGAYNQLPSRPEEARKALGVALDRGAEAITAARDTVQKLRTPPSGANELSSAIAALSEELRVSQTEGLSPAVEFEVEGGERELNPMLRDEIYRITAEALRNAFRHAQAARIDVAIRHGDHEFRIAVKDNGKGIDPEVLKQGSRRGHWGLTGMRERAEAIGAELDVWSSNGNGTEVSLRVPAAIAYISSGRRLKWASRTRREAG
jgi:signal transduction histidine kinase/ligand-binding sensor domain-containing protein